MSIINHIALLPISEDILIRQTMHTFHSIISFQNHKDSEQDYKTENLYYNTNSDCSPHHTSERSIHGPSMLQQLAGDLDKLLTTYVITLPIGYIKIVDDLLN
jgi:hypothetical protein